MMLAALVGLLCASFVTAMGVVGIDYGTESMKVSLVKPGLPFDVVLSRDSKRKIPSAVAWKMQERLYGSDAANLATRYPGDTFLGAKLLLGRSIESVDDQARLRQSELLGSQLIPSVNRSSVSVKRETDYTINKEGSDEYTVEELVGMQLSHARTLAEETAGEEVIRTFPGSVGTFGGLDVVITTPIFYTAAERQALFDAASVAGLRPKLVSDGAAAAVNFALTRQFTKPERHLFFDSGAGSTRATLVEFSTKQVQADSILSIGSTQKEATVIQVLSAGWDRQASGLALDILLRDHLAGLFQTQHGSKLAKPVKDQPRAMARLLKEANRVKHILSANADASSNVEGLADDIDFRAKVTRDEFESLADKAGLRSRFGQPATDALKEAKLTINDIDSVIYVGGTTRVPLVQAALREAGVPDAKIAQNVNADEAAVMGAAFYGASFNPQFRMKTIRAHDGNPYPVVLTEEGKKPDVIFPGGSFETTQVVRNYTDTTSNFGFQIDYDAAIPQAKLDTFEHRLYDVEIQEINNHLAGLKERGEIDQVDISVNVTITSRPLGVYAVESAFMHVKQKPGGIAGALKSFFNVGSNAVAEDVDDDDEAAEGADAAATTEDADAAAEGAADTKKDAEGDETSEKSEKKDVKKKNKKALPTDRSIRLLARSIPRGSVRPMSGAELKAASDRLYVADVEARRKAAREEAQNVLEAYIYRARDIVHETRFIESSKASEREAITAKASELSDWLASQAEEADTSSLKLKRASLESLIQPIEKRMREQGTRQGSLDRFTRAQAEAREFLQEARTNLTKALEEGVASKYSLAELDGFQTQLDKDLTWFQDGEKEQAKRSKDDDVAIKSDDIDRRAKKARDTMARMLKRRIPKTRPPKKSKAPPPPAKEDKPAAEEPKKKEENEEKPKKGHAHEEL